MKRSTPRWLLLLAACFAGLAISLGAIACGDDGDDGDGGEEPTATSEGAEPTEPAASDIPQLDVTATDFAFDVPAEFGGGWVRIVMNNAGAEDHQGQLVKLNDGVTFDQLTAALQADETGSQALALVSLAGGPNAIKPGETADVVNELEAGDYALLCFVSGADDIPHLAKGMISPLTITEPAAEQPAPPDAYASVVTSDFQFDAPDTLPSGEQVIEVQNDGPQPHEMTLVKLDEGVTFEDLQALLASEEEPTGPPPFSSAGGLGAIAPGTSGYTTLNLDAGTYALLCFVPDPDSGAPHFALGMVDSFTVQ
jgi:uncharacterized cupredoxin-like copper-binding protein